MPYFFLNNVRKGGILFSFMEFSYLLFSSEDSIINGTATKVQCKLIDDSSVFEDGYCQRRGRGRESRRELRRENM